MHVAARSCSAASRSLRSASISLPAWFSLSRSGTLEKDARRLAAGVRVDKTQGAGWMLDYGRVSCVFPAATQVGKKEIRAAP